MGSIGAPELIVVTLVLVMIIAAVLLVLRGIRAASSGPSLAACPSCRGKVSARAKACPHCGDPLT